MLAVAGQPDSRTAGQPDSRLPKPKPERHARLLHVMVRNPARNASMNPAHLSIWPRPDGWCRRCMGERCQGPAASAPSVHGDIPVSGQGPERHGLDREMCRQGARGMPKAAPRS